MYYNIKMYLFQRKVKKFNFFNFFIMNDNDSSEYSLATDNLTQETYDDIIHNNITIGDITNLNNENNHINNTNNYVNNSENNENIIFNDIIVYPSNSINYRFTKEQKLKVENPHNVGGFVDLLLTDKFYNFLQSQINNRILKENFPNSKTYEKDRHQIYPRT